MNASLNAPNYPPSLPFPSLHFTSHLVNHNTYTFPLVHHINHFPNPLSKSISFTGESKISASNRIQSRMVLFTKEYFPIYVLCLLFLIFRIRSTLLR